MSRRAHISKSGQPGGGPACGRVGSRAGAVTMPLAKWLKEAPEDRCARCALKPYAKRALAEEANAAEVPWWNQDVSDWGRS